MGADHEEPVVTDEGGPMGGQRITHPAFACIRASRVSGSANLYDSDFRHQHYVTVTIAKSEMVRSLSNDWHHGRGELIEVALSESQWAHFVSSMNVGSGSPCTLTRAWGPDGYHMVPELPDPKPMTEKFAKEIKHSMSENCIKLRTLAAEIAAGGAMSKTRANEIAKVVDHISQSLTGTTKFIADQFDEHVERTVDKAKTEINAYTMNAVVKAGLTALGAPINTPEISLDKPVTTP